MKLNIPPVFSKPLSSELLSVATDLKLVDEIKSSIP